MAKFSLFRDEEEEEEEDDDDIEGGPTCPTRKRPRLLASNGSSTSTPSSAEPDADPQPEEEEGYDRIREYFTHSVEAFGTESGLRSPIVADDQDRDGEPESQSAATSAVRSVSVCLIDPDVLDCCICFEPLTVPVFQCENGHTACSSCCTKLGNKCPTCSWPIGYNRCRAIEKVLESVKIACQNKQHGCREMVTYSKKKDHEKACTYAPFTCPLTHCNFVSSFEQLNLHLKSRHSDFTVRFRYNRNFHVSLNANENILVLREPNDDILFILNRRVENLGSVVWVSCILPGSLKRWFDYDISAKNEVDTLTLQSTTTCAQGQVDSLPLTGFLLVPSDFLRTPGQVKLNLNIFGDGQTLEESERSIGAA